MFDSVVSVHVSEASFLLLYVLLLNYFPTVPIVLSTPTVLVNDVYTPNATALVSYTALYTGPLATVSLQLWATPFDTSQLLPSTIAFNNYTFVTLLGTNLAIGSAVQTFIWYDIILDMTVM